MVFNQKVTFQIGVVRAQSPWKRSGTTWSHVLNINCSKLVTREERRCSVHSAIKVTFALLTERHVSIKRQFSNSKKPFTWTDSMRFLDESKSLLYPSICICYIIFIYTQFTVQTSNFGSVCPQTPMSHWCSYTQCRVIPPESLLERYVSPALHWCNGSISGMFIFMGVVRWKGLLYISIALTCSPLLYTTTHLIHSSEQILQVIEVEHGR